MGNWPRFSFWAERRSQAPPFAASLAGVLSIPLRGSLCFLEAVTTFFSADFFVGDDPTTRFFASSGRVSAFTERQSSSSAASFFFEEGVVLFILVYVDPKLSRAMGAKLHLLLDIGGPRGASHKHGSRGKARRFPS